MTAQLIPFPPKAKPRAVLRVPTTNNIVALWSDLNWKIAIAWANPTPENNAAMKAANLRYCAALTDEQEPA